VGKQAWHKQAWQRAAVAAAGLAVVAAVARQGSAAPWLDDRLRDDAFYEFVWAANLAGGIGPTVSDGTTTSGVQVLWSSLLAVVAWCLGPAALPIAAPWLGAILHLGTAWLWLVTVRPRWLGGACALLWLGHPLLLRECLNGQETALACLCALQLWRTRRASPLPFGLWSALAGLARSDLFGLALALAVAAGRRHVVAALVAVVPFVVVNLSLGGGALPDSAAPMAWLWHANFALTAPTLAESLAQHWWFLRPALLGGPFATVSVVGTALVGWRLVRPWWPATWRCAPLVAVAAAAAVGVGDWLVPAGLAVLLALAPRTSVRARWPRAFAAAAMGLGAIVFVHWALRWYPRDYYLAPLVVAALLALRMARRSPWLVVAYAAAQTLSAWQFVGEPLAGQRAMELAGRFLGEVAPAEVRVGSFNSGILTWFQGPGAAVGTRRGVVNLDGVVDPRALSALRRGDLLAWLDAEGIVAIVDNRRQLSVDPRQAHACGHWLAPEFAVDREFRAVAQFRGPGTEAFEVFVRSGAAWAPPVWPNSVRFLGRDGRGDRVIGWSAAPDEVLRVELPAGERRVLMTAPYEGRFIFAVPSADLGTGRLFVGEADAPALDLSGL
jgi:hypothetical protein